jgi:hypothetical protein
MLSKKLLKCSGTKNDLDSKSMHPSPLQHPPLSGRGDRKNIYPNHTFSMEANLFVMFGVVHRFGSNLHTR